MRGGESGPVVSLGEPDKSSLFEKVRIAEMPPDPEIPLPRSEVDLLERWISAGCTAEQNTTDPSGSGVTDHDVLPTFLLRCTVCHGLRRQEAGLDLRTRESILHGGKSGPAIVLGAPADSLLVQKIRAGDMPPKKSLLDAGVKPVPARELAQIEAWVLAGAPQAPPIIDLASTPDDPLVHAQDREFWAFQPARRVEPPSVAGVHLLQNPVDAFLLASLEAAGLSFAPEADRATLIRRLSFDLTGLPPDPTDVDEFLHDPDEQAYEKLVDRMLASPRHGERWGRYWLDAVGYADSEGGKLDADHPRPHAWRYRDYVIRSLNNDKPYDRFLLEQIAGDELADYEHAPTITHDLYDQLVATGFLRMGPDSTSEREVAFGTDRVDVIADEIDILSSTLLGLTLRCARCHNHKYDPLPQRDYYRLAAIFKGAYDEHDWLKPRPGSEKQYRFDLRTLPYVTTQEKLAWESEKQRIEREIDVLRKDLEQRSAALQESTLNQRLAALPEVLRDDLRKMLATAPESRDDVLKYLAEKFESSLRVRQEDLPGLDAEFARAAKEIQDQIAAFESQRQPEPMIQALWDRGTPSPSYIYQRGDVENPGAWVQPGVPAVLTDGRTPFSIAPPWEGASSTGRRLAFARWLVRPDHPLTARVLVNRVWARHFGAGLVRSLGNFGHTGVPPTHPELLDWLATEFVNQGYRLKSLHRLLVTSRAYRQGSRVTPELERLDPENRLLSRMPLQRLDAEAVRDAMLWVSGQLDARRQGPADPVDVREDGLVTVLGTERGWRRSIYARQRRKEIPTFLETFDLPAMNPNCLERTESIVAPQALLLLNNAEVLALARAFAERVLREVGPDPALQVTHVFRLALGREPGTQEQQLGEQALASLTAEWAAASAEAAPSGVTPSGGTPDVVTPAPTGPASTAPAPTAPAPTAPARALADYCHILFNSGAFLYVD